MNEPTPSRSLSGSEILDDPLVRELLDARLVGVFATLDQNGTIHAVPMWFVLHERSILLATSARSRKVRNVEADNRATLVVHDSRPGFEVCGVSILGEAEVVGGPEARSLVGRVHRRYVVDEGLPDEARSFLESDDVALCFRPLAATTWDERASGANAALRAAGGARPLVPNDPRP